MSLYTSLNASPFALCGPCHLTCRQFDGILSGVPGCLGSKSPVVGRAARRGSMEEALRFIAAFPDALAFHVTVLSSEKRCLTNKTSIGAAQLRRELKQWLDLRHVHIYIRPLLSTLIFLHLDAYKKDWDVLVRLRPRALVQTSPGNYQAWFTLSSDVAARTATWATQELTRALGADARSCKMSQQGRLPGSTNVKPGKDCLVTMLHSDVCDIDESVLLSCLGPQPKLAVSTAKVSVALAKSAVGAEKSVSKEDRSATDWRMVCQFCEGQPDATVEMASAALEGWDCQWASEQFFPLKRIFSRSGCLIRRLYIF